MDRGRAHSDADHGASAVMRKSSHSRKDGLPPEAVAVLKEWMMAKEHVGHPYPTDEEKKQLAAASGLEIKQVVTWFANARKRLWKPALTSPAGSGKPDDGSPSHVSTPHRGDSHRSQGMSDITAQMHPELSHRSPLPSSMGMRGVMMGMPQPPSLMGGGGYPSHGMPPGLSQHHSAYSSNASPAYGVPHPRLVPTFVGGGPQSGGMMSLPSLHPGERPGYRTEWVPPLLSPMQSQGMRSNMSMGMPHQILHNIQAQQQQSSQASHGMHQQMHENQHRLQRQSANAHAGNSKSNTEAEDGRGQSGGKGKGKKRSSTDGSTKKGKVSSNNTKKQRSDDHSEPRQQQQHQGMSQYPGGGDYGLVRDPEDSHLMRMRMHGDSDHHGHLSTQSTSGPLSHSMGQGQHVNMTLFPGHHPQSSPHPHMMQRFPPPQMSGQQQMSRSYMQGTQPSSSPYHDHYAVPQHMQHEVPRVSQILPKVTGPSYSPSRDPSMRDARSAQLTRSPTAPIDRPPELLPLSAAQKGSPPMSVSLPGLRLPSVHLPPPSSLAQEGYGAASASFRSHPLPHFPADILQKASRVKSPPIPDGAGQKETASVRASETALARSPTLPGHSSQSTKVSPVHLRQDNNLGSAPSPSRSPAKKFGKDKKTDQGKGGGSGAKKAAEASTLSETIKDEEALHSFGKAAKGVEKSTSSSTKKSPGEKDGSFQKKKKKKRLFSQVEEAQASTSTHGSKEDNNAEGTQKHLKKKKKLKKLERQQEHAQQHTPKKRGKIVLPTSTVAYLKRWIMDPQHIQHPYPTEAQKREIIEATGIKMKQLTNWFTNNRKRFWKPRVEGLAGGSTGAPSEGLSSDEDSISRQPAPVKKKKKNASDSPDAKSGGKRMSDKGKGKKKNLGIITHTSDSDSAEAKMNSSDEDDDDDPDSGLPLSRFKNAGKVPQRSPSTAVKPASAGKKKLSPGKTGKGAGKKMGGGALLQHLKGSGKPKKSTASSPMSAADLWSSSSSSSSIEGDSENSDSSYSSLSGPESEWQSSEEDKATQSSIKYPPSFSRYLPTSLVRQHWDVGSLDEGELESAEAYPSQLAVSEDAENKRIVHTETVDLHVLRTKNGIYTVADVVATRPGVRAEIKGRIVADTYVNRSFSYLPQLGDHTTDISASIYNRTAARREFSLSLLKEDVLEEHAMKPTALLRPLLRSQSSDPAGVETDGEDNRLISSAPEDPDAWHDAVVEALELQSTATEEPTSQSNVAEAGAQTKLPSFSQALRLWKFKTLSPDALAAEISVRQKLAEETRRRKQRKIARTRAVSDDDTSSESDWYETPYYELTQERATYLERLAQAISNIDNPSAPSMKAEGEPTYSNSEKPANATHTGGGDGLTGKDRGAAQSEDAQEAVRRDDVWVQCDKCLKWRRLPDFVDADALPPKWFCAMNKWDMMRNACDKPEEEYRVVLTDGVYSDVRARRATKSLARRLRLAVKVARRFKKALPIQLPTQGKDGAILAGAIAPAAVGPETAGDGKVEWIQCANPSCGKWRALLKEMDASLLPEEWYCVMNTWDENHASCGAPQEVGWLKPVVKKPAKRPLAGGGKKGLGAKKGAGSVANRPKETERPASKSKGGAGVLIKLKKKKKGIILKTKKTGENGKGTLGLSSTAGAKKKPKLSSNMKLSALTNGGKSGAISGTKKVKKKLVGAGKKLSSLATTAAADNSNSASSILSGKKMVVAI